MVARVTPASAHSAKSAPVGITMATTRPDGAFDDLVSALPEPMKSSGVDQQQAGDGRSRPRGTKFQALEPQLPINPPAPEGPAGYSGTSGPATNVRFRMTAANGAQSREAHTHESKDTPQSTGEPTFQYTSGNPAILQLSAPAIADGAGRTAPVDDAASTGKISAPVATTGAPPERPRLEHPIPSQPIMPEDTRKPDHIKQAGPHEVVQLASPSVQPQPAAHLSQALPEAAQAQQTPQPTSAASGPPPVPAAHHPDPVQGGSSAVQSPLPASPASNLPAATVVHSFTPQRVTIRLSPPELGSLQIRIDRPPDAPPKVEIRVEHAQTLNLLLHDQPRLHQALDQAGVPPEGRNVVLLLDQSGGGQSPAGDGRSGNSGRSGVARMSGSGASADHDDVAPAQVIWNSAGLNVIA